MPFFRSTTSLLQLLLDLDYDSIKPDLIVIVSSRQRDYLATKFFPREDDYYAPIQRAGFTRLAVMTFSLESYLWIMGNPDSDVGRYVRTETAKLVKK